MAEFDVSHAALTGFRIVRARPRAVALWALVQVVLTFGFQAALVVMAGPGLMHIRPEDLAVQTDPNKALAMLKEVAPVYLVLLVYGLAVYPVLYSAMNRAVMRPADDRFGYLRLGGDELRQFLLLIVYGLTLAAALFGLVIAVVVVGVLGALIGSVGGPQTSEMVSILAVAIVLVGGACGLVIAAVRLSFASALTFATRRLNLFGSWKMTQGRFWPMLATYLFALGLYVVVGLLVLALSSGVAAAIAGEGGMPSLVNADMNSLQAYFIPARTAYLAISGLSSALMWPLLLTPAATLYRTLAPSFGHPDGGDGQVVSVFA